MCEYVVMKKKSTYEIDGDLYEFNNEKLRKIIQSKNPNRGAFEQFYRKVVSKNAGITYEAAKGWVYKNTNPAINDVKTIAEILKIPYMHLLNCTHYSVHTVRTRCQKISFTEVVDPFSFRYCGFSNVLDMVIGVGYNRVTKESIDSDYAERIINIIKSNIPIDCGLPELLGYKFIYTEDELRKMSEDELIDSLNRGYVDAEGNSFFDKDNRIAIDRSRFGELLIKNISWLNEEDHKELQEIIEEADGWWDYCDMPFAMLKVNINICGQCLASFTYGPGWTKPTHEDRWKLILDILAFLGLQVENTGLCLIDEMHIDQFESEVFLTIEIMNH